MNLINNDYWVQRRVSMHEDVCCSLFCRRLDTILGSVDALAVALPLLFDEFGALPTARNASRIGVYGTPESGPRRSSHL